MSSKNLAHGSSSAVAAVNLELFGTGNMCLVLQSLLKQKFVSVQLPARTKKVMECGEDAIDQWIPIVNDI